MRNTLKTLALLALALLLISPAFADQDKESDLSTVVDNAATELRVKTALLGKIGWDMIDTDVEAHGTHVTLLGEAESKAHCELAKEVALSVEGVHTVDNRLKLEEEPTEAPVGDAVAKAEREVKDAILESRVKTALIAEMGTNAFDIEVEATDGEVSLRGHLSQEQQEEIALSTAKSTKGVEKVVDLLTVKS
jgi:osmotically-inducible protein OsmY